MAHADSDGGGVATGFATAAGSCRGLCAARGGNATTFGGVGVGENAAIAASDGTRVSEGTGALSADPVDAGALRSEVSEPRVTSSRLSTNTPAAPATALTSATASQSRLGDLGAAGLVRSGVQLDAVRPSGCSTSSRCGRSDALDGRTADGGGKLPETREMRTSVALDWGGANGASASASSPTLA
jgi:hypothetical protein